MKWSQSIPGARDKSIWAGVFALAALLMGTAALEGVANAQQGGAAKPKIVAFGSDSPERGTTRVGYWDVQKNHGLAQFAIDYGRPVWKKDYEDQAKFDAFTKGKVYRLGANFWTTLDTDIPIKISGVAIPVGSWYLGLHRSEDGASWSLAFIDPAKARAAHVDASEIARAPISFKVPVKIESSTETREKLTIDLLYQKENLRDVKLRIAWGNIQFGAPIEVPINN
jgi:hypothetical protein